MVVDKGWRHSTYRTLSSLFWFLSLLLIGACAQTTVRPMAQIGQRQLAPPTRILLYRFAIDENDVTEYQGIMRQQPSNPNPLQRQRFIADRAAATLADYLSDGLRNLGLKANTVERGTPVGEGELLIDGQFLQVDEGNPLRRWILGFGAGGAKMATRVQAFYGPQRRRVLEFTTESASSKLPGAIATAPASAVAPAAIGVGIAAGSAVSKGAQGDLTSAEQMAAANAEQAARFLSEFFAQQGWIEPAQVRKARMATR